MSYFPEEDFTVINGIWAIEEERFLEITVNGRVKGIIIIKIMYFIGAFANPINFIISVFSGKSPIKDTKTE